MFLDAAVHFLPSLPWTILYCVVLLVREPPFLFPTSPIPRRYLTPTPETNPLPSPSSTNS